MPYPNEHACRLVDPDKVKVVGSEEREHDGKKYRVIFGKPKGGDGSVEQAYRYPVDGWSESEARSHCKSHDGILFEPATGKGAGMEFKFMAGIVKLEAEGKKAIFYLMNTSRNRNGWGVTEKALEEGLPSIKGKTIGCGKEYKLGHFKPDETMDAGKWVDYAKTGSYALGMAKIDDQVVWDKLETGEWGPISVVIESYQEHCSICGEDLRKTPPDQHEHTTKGAGYLIVDSFKFIRVDFVEDAAYPQAGLQELLSQSADPNPMAIELVAGYYQSLSTEDPATGTGAPPGRKTGKVKDMTEKTIEELKAELTATQAELTATKAKLTTTQTDLDATRAAKHTELVNAAAEARFKAGLATDLKAEAEKIKTRSDVDLIEMKADAEKVKTLLDAKAKRTPKAEYGEGEEDALQAAIEKAREDFGFAPRKKEG